MRSSIHDGMERSSPQPKAKAIFDANGETVGWLYHETIYDAAGKVRAFLHKGAIWSFSGGCLGTWHRGFLLDGKGHAVAFTAGASWALLKPAIKAPSCEPPTLVTPTFRPLIFISRECAPFTGQWSFMTWKEFLS